MPLMELEDDAILCEPDYDGRVVWIVLNRPATLNSLTIAAYKRICELVAAAEDDDSVKLIGFRGNGRAFSSGHDVGEAYDFYLREGEDPRIRPSMRRRAATMDGSLWGPRGVTEVIFRCLKPTIAKVHHRCFGSGLDILMACDMAIASDDTLFGHPGFTYHGFGGDLASYVHHLGIKKAKEFTLTARPFDAAMAERLGVINRSVAPAALDGAVDELIRDVLKMPADALVMQKLHYRVVLDGMGFATNFSAALQALVLASNIKYESGDNIMVRDKQSRSVSDTIQARKKFYGHA